MLNIAIANQQSALAIDERRLKAAARRVLRDAGWTGAAVSIAIVDDPTLQVLNRRYLNHDWPTDVLSFVYDRDRRHLNGEVIASADTAIRAAAELAWNPHDELLLYVVHGVLHLVGCDDTTRRAAAEMRRREREVLTKLGVVMPSGDTHR